MVKVEFKSQTKSRVKLRWRPSAFCPSPSFDGWSPLLSSVTDHKLRATPKSRKIKPNGRTRERGAICQPGKSRRRRFFFFSPVRPSSTFFCQMMTTAELKLRQSRRPKRHHGARQKPNLKTSSFSAAKEGGRERVNYFSIAHLAGKCRGGEWKASLPPSLFGQETKSKDE